MVNDELAARLEGLAQIYATANPAMVPTLQRAAEDARKGKSRKTVARELVKLQRQANDPSSTIRRAAAEHLKHFGQ